MDLDDFPAIALVQMDVQPGRPDVNTARMLEHLATARAGGAELVVFSELCVTGYILGDLWEVDSLVEDFAAYSDEIRRSSRGLTVVFGNVAVDPNRIGEDGRRRKYNAVHVCHDGRYVGRPELPAAGFPSGVQPKTLHPNYRFFDDDRHFYSVRKLSDESGRPIEDWLVPFEIEAEDGRRFRFGVQLCEDIWCQDYRYAGDILDSLHVYHRRGAQAVFNLSSSPWTWQKNDKRNRTVREVLARSPVPLLYVNHVGAQNNGKNIIVFDGDTTVYDSSGAIQARATPWREEVVHVRAPSRVAPSHSEVEGFYHGILSGLRHFDQLRGGEGRYLVGVSGGIDSSVVACLLTIAFGPDRVFAVNMPTRFNADVTRDNARALCEALKLVYASYSIQGLYEHVADTIKGARLAGAEGEYTGLVDENIQARIRGADILPGLAAKFGLVFTNNGNKTELALGYATLYGDVNGAVAPIADLYKTQIYALARHLNQARFGREVVPSNLYDGTVVPSAELSDDQDVTRGLGDPIKYGYHDAVLRQMIEYRHHPLDFLRWYLNRELLDRLEWRDEVRFQAYFPDSGAWVADLEWVDRQLRASYFKRVQAPPIIVLSKRAFGFDLRESQLSSYRPRDYAAVRKQVLELGSTAPTGVDPEPAREPPHPSAAS